MRDIPLTTLSMELIKLAAWGIPTLQPLTPEQTQAIVDKSKQERGRTAWNGAQPAMAGSLAGFGALGGGAAGLLVEAIKRLTMSEEDKKKEEARYGSHALAGAAGGGLMGGLAGNAFGRVFDAQQDANAAMPAITSAAFSNWKR